MYLNVSLGIFIGLLIGFLISTITLHYMYKKAYKEYTDAIYIQYMRALNAVKKEKKGLYFELNNKKGQ